MLWIKFINVWYGDMFNKDECLGDVYRCWKDIYRERYEYR